MKAVQLVGHGVPGRFEFREVPDPSPGPDEVVVQVHACGLNHLDLWLEQGKCHARLFDGLQPKEEGVVDPLHQHILIDLGEAQHPFGECDDVVFPYGNAAESGCFNHHVELSYFQSVI